jgi:hypothetical protein
MGSLLGTEKRAVTAGFTGDVISTPDSARERLASTGAKKKGAKKYNRDTIPEKIAKLGHSMSSALVSDCRRRTDSLAAPVA